MNLVTDSSEPREPTGEDPETGQMQRLTQRLRREHPPLALWLRVLLFLVGWLLVLLGIAGLVLPGLQGVLTLLLGAAVLSLVSELAYKILRSSFRPWPRGWRRVAGWRKKIRRKLVHWTHGPDPGPQPPDDTDPPGGTPPTGG